MLRCLTIERTQQNCDKMCICVPAFYSVVLFLMTYTVYTAIIHDYYTTDK